MESRLYILLLLASIAQSAYVPKLQVYHALSGKQVAVLNELRANQYEAVNIFYASLKTIFEILCGLDNDCDNDCSRVYEAVLQMEKGVDLSYDSIDLIVEDSCSEIEVVRNATHTFMQAAAAATRTACELAASGNYQDTQNGIETNSIRPGANLRILVEKFYGLVLTCLDIRDPAAIAVVEYAQNQSFIYGSQMTSSVFNTIYLRGATTSGVCEDRDFLNDLEDFEKKALFGIRHHLEYEFATLSTFYIYDDLRKNGILPQLAANQYALSESLRGYQDGDDIFYYTIIRYLKYIHLGINDDGKLDFSRDDGSIAEAIAHYDAGDSSNLASILLLHPKSYSEIAAVREILFDMNAAGTQGLFNLIHAAIVPGANYSQVMDNIGTARDEVADIARNFAENYFIIIRNDQSFNEKLDTELKKLLKKTTDNLAVALHAYLDAIVILANAAHSGEVSKDDISAVLAYRDAGSEGNDKYTQGISAASYLVLLTQNNNNRG